VNEELEGVIGERKEDCDCKSTRPGRFGFAKRLGQCSIKAGSDATEEHGGNGRGQAGGEIGEEKDCGSEHRAEKSGLPIPALDENAEKVAQKAQKDRTDGAVKPENG
jgi:hypothetical protein